MSPERVAEISAMSTATPEGFAVWMANTTIEERKEHYRLTHPVVAPKPVAVRRGSQVCRSCGTVCYGDCRY